VPSLEGNVLALAVGVDRPVHRMPTEVRLDLYVFARGRALEGGALNPYEACVELAQVPFGDSLKYFGLEFERLLAGVDGLPDARLPPAERADKIGQLLRQPLIAVDPVVAVAARCSELLSLRPAVGSTAFGALKLADGQRIVVSYGSSSRAAGGRLTRRRKADY
jgi:hypothetical protein